MVQQCPDLDPSGDLVVDAALVMDRGSLAVVVFVDGVLCMVCGVWWGPLLQVAQFMSFTGANKDAATNCLRAFNWSVDHGTNDYFDNPSKYAPPPPLPLHHECVTPIITQR